MCLLDRIATLPKSISFNLDIYSLSQVDDFGTRILKVRKGKNLTAKELGTLLNISTSAVINYENGNAYPSRNVLLKMVNVLGKDILCDDYSKIIVTDYGSIIKQWRKDNNYTCEEAAKYIGVSMRMLYALESMEYIPTRKRFDKFKDNLKELVTVK